MYDETEETRMARAAALEEMADIRKLRISAMLMERIASAAAGNGVRIDWGKPDSEGFYEPTVVMARGMGSASPPPPLYPARYTGGSV